LDSGKIIIAIIPNNNEINLIISKYMLRYDLEYDTISTGLSPEEGWNHISQKSSILGPDLVM
jgi:hypothetical protein